MILRARGHLAIARIASTTLICASWAGATACDSGPHQTQRSDDTAPSADSAADQQDDESSVTSSSAETDDEGEALTGEPSNVTSGTGDELESSGTGDGDGDGDSSGESSSNTGDQAECGNGIVEDIEACDDGNKLSGDGCEPDCTVSTLGGWEIELGEAGSGIDLVMRSEDGVRVVGSFYDAANSSIFIADLDREGQTVSVTRRPGRIVLPTLGRVFMDADGRTYLLEFAGEKDQTGNTPAPWAVALEPDLGLAWEHVVADYPSVIMASAGVSDGQLGLAAIGSNESGFRLWNGLFAAQGPLHSTFVELEGTGYVTDAAVIPGGSIITLVDERVDDAGANWVYALSPAGELQWRVRLDESGADDLSLTADVLSHANGVWLVGNTKTDDAHSVAVSVDAHGTVAPAVWLGDSEGSPYIARVSPTGKLLIGGRQDAVRGGSAPWVAEYSQTGVLLREFLLGKGQRDGDVRALTSNTAGVIFALYDRGSDDARETWIAKLPAQ